MALYLLSYDLREPNFDYKSFYDALNAMEAKRIQNSVWGVRTTSSAEVVYKYLLRHMHSPEDRLFVVMFDKTQSFRAINCLSKLSDL
jgi:CRISPR/Cas system-associated endoribonuclease Cas2